jgi:hypothetical protein
MIPGDTLEKIGRIVGADHLLQGERALEEYASDATKLTYMPDAVAFPSSSLLPKEAFPSSPEVRAAG